jgi:hypothetical protein
MGAPGRDTTWYRPTVQQSTLVHHNRAQPIRRTAYGNWTVSLSSWSHAHSRIILSWQHCQHHGAAGATERQPVAAAQTNSERS